MNIHEYQAKEILKNYGIKVSDFVIVESTSQVQEALDRLKVGKAVLKVQVHAGGRGKAGGVKLAKNKEEVHAFAKELIGKKIVNNQTTSAGVIASKVMIAPLIDYEKEYYVGAVIDREKAAVTLILSPEGGMEIEEIAEKTPERILKLTLPLSGKLRGYQLLEACKFMGWDGKTKEEGKKLLVDLSKAFMELDASLLEINPLVKTKEGDLIALDAKLSVDENALFRQKKLAECYDRTQVPKNEAMANEYGLAYVALDGEIGCMVNGAGLAMATMDLIHLHGGTAANFLDVGGSASKEKVAEGFKIILSDPHVKAILVNIFGGIMNCETLALGIIYAAGTLEVQVPLIVRMEGTNVEKGKELLAKSGLNITIANNLTEAAIKAVDGAKKGAKR